VTLNVALMHLRARRRRGWRSEGAEALERMPEPAGRAGPDELAGQRERLRLVHRIIGGLAPKKRIVFVLYHFEGHTLEEIAELTGASIHTVASRLRAARKELQRALARHALRERRAIA
jgi:RNA polymerase sigma-70 factor (ECF subfamily)